MNPRLTEGNNLSIITRAAYNYDRLRLPGEATIGTHNPATAANAALICRSHFKTTFE
jgi:hypothetical protein